MMSLPYHVCQGVMTPRVMTPAEANPFLLGWREIQGLGLDSGEEKEGRNMYLPLGKARKIMKTSTEKVSANCVCVCACMCVCMCVCACVWGDLFLISL